MVLRQILPEMVEFFLEVAGDEERMEDVESSSWTQRVLKYLADLKLYMRQCSNHTPSKSIFVGHSEVIGRYGEAYTRISSVILIFPFLPPLPGGHWPLSEAFSLLFSCLIECRVIHQPFPKGPTSSGDALDIFNVALSMSSFHYWSFSAWNDGIGSILLGRLLPLRLGLAFSTGYCHSSMQVPLPLAR